MAFPPDILTYLAEGPTRYHQLRLMTRKTKGSIEIISVGLSSLVILQHPLTYLKSRTRVSNQIRPTTKAHSSSPIITMLARTPPTEAPRKDAAATSTSRATAPGRMNRGTVQMMKINQPDSLFNNLSPKTVRLSLLTRIPNGICMMGSPP